MRTVELYRYTRPDGGIDVSPIKPEDTEYEINYRLIADEGKTLTNGTDVCPCIDVDSTEGWTEIDAVEEEVVVEP